jgi:hypothetical protein
LCRCDVVVDGMHKWLVDGVDGSTSCIINSTQIVILPVAL